MASIVGAQLPEEQIEWKPTLSSMGMEKTIAVFNPLQDDFRVQYSRSLAVLPAADPNRMLARERAGLDLSKAVPQKHVPNWVVLKAGKTINLPGDIAQKAVQDLTTYIISIRNKALIADPHKRQEVEKELILSIKDTTEFMNRPTAEEFTEKQLADLNPEPTQTPAQLQEQAEAIPNPPPGSGISYTPAQV